MGSSVSSAGDVNGDGYMDILVGANGESGSLPDVYPTPPGQVTLFYGGPSITKESIQFSGSYAGGGLDSNGDGFSDIFYDNSLHYGGPTISVTPDDTIDSGRWPLGDINGDGFEDLLGYGPTIQFGSKYNGLGAPASLGGQSILGTGDYEIDGIDDLIMKQGSDIQIFSFGQHLLTLPEIQITAPKNFTTTRFPDTTITGKVTGNLAKFMISGQEIQVLADGNFSHSVTLIEGENVFEIIAETENGEISKYVLTIIYQLPPPLTVTITSPADGATVNANTVSVSGTVSDDSATVTVNGIAAMVTGNSYQADVALSEGFNTITVVADDIYGSTASQNITVTSVTRGTIEGVVTDTFSTQPLGGVSVLLTDSQNQIFSHLTDASGYYVIDDVSQGAFTVSFQKAGYVQKNLSGSLAAGEMQTVNTQLAQIPPLTVSITSPQNNETIYALPPVVVSGTVSDSSAIVSVNGISAIVTGTSFQASVDLVAGNNTITVTADDQYGQTQTQIISVTLVTTGTITGTVTELLAGSPIPGATAIITDAKNDTHTATTGLDGTFTFASIASGPYTGSITMSGYVEATLAGNMTAGATEVIDRALENLSPTVSISANPVEINRGESSTLSWNTEYADTCTLDPASVPVGCTGEMTVTPLVDTQYKFTATGPGGSASMQINIVVIQPVPTISLVAQPATITSGESSTLNWSTEYADTCTLDPSPGSVDCTGEMTVTPFEDTQYTFTATGLGGSASQQATVAVTPASPISLTITSPVAGETITGKTVHVSGTITHADNLETGVMVNGTTAHVYGGQFVANRVSLQAGENTITVRAVDFEGELVEESVVITATPLTRNITLNANIESGLVPMEATLSHTSNFNIAGSATLSYYGPDNITFLGGEPGTWNIAITVPGIYYFDVEAQDESGEVYTDVLAILAMDRAIFDNLLKAKWSRMKQAMRDGDIEACVQEFTYSQRETFREVFTLQSDKLAQIADEMQDIGLMYQKNDTAEYRIKKDILFNGVPENVTFHIYFDREGDGIWRIRDF